MVTRLSVWKRKHGRSEDVLEQGVLTEEPSKEHEPVPSLQDSPDHFDATNVWDYYASPPRLAMTDVISDKVLELILETTGAKCRMDLNHGKIFIGASSEAKCDQAYRKLNVIRKYAVCN